MESRLINRTKRYFPVKESIRLIITLFGVSVITFLMLEFVPGDAAEMILTGQSDAVSAEKVAALRKELGLDSPLPVRYFRWLRRAVFFDFGKSFRTGDPVSREILIRIPTTLTLAFFTFLFAVSVSVAGGIISAVFQNRIPDKCHRLWTILLVSIPDYWLGLILMLIFSLKLQWISVTGNQGFKSFILPVLTLGLSVSASEGRVLRAGILEILSQDYLLFAYAKGLTPVKVFIRHVFKAAVLPMISMWGMLLGHLLGGAVIVESVFSLPGLGKLAADAVLNRDMPMIQGTVLTMTFFFIITGWFMEIIYFMLIPQHRKL